MKTKILFVLLCFLSLNVMGQGIVRRNKPQTTQTQPTKTKKKTNSASKPTPKPAPEAAGYDVTFTCNVPSATLYVDGKDSGNAGDTHFMKTGNHSIKVTAEGYEDYESNLDVNSQNKSCKITLEKKPEPKPAPEAAGYDVTFSCNVPTATMSIDGNANSNANGTLFLKTGTHRIRVTADGYEDYEGSLDVNRQNKSCKITLEKKQAVGPKPQEISSQTFTVKGVSFTMMKVEAGTFMMGATLEQTEAENDEKPAHEVTLTNGYYMGETEVTQALWEAVMGKNPSKFKGENRPVERVNWNDCQKFISKLNGLTGKRFRLPTEAEWEFAARGGNKSKGYKYSGSSNLDDVAWYYDNSGKETHPVKTKSPNELGLYDMSGNVSEWCQDWYGKKYYNSSSTNPTGPSSGSYRVTRGGTWVCYARICRSSIRRNNSPGITYNYLGLRLALSE